MAIGFYHLGTICTVLKRNKTSLLFLISYFLIYTIVFESKRIIDKKNLYI